MLALLLPFLATANAQVTATGANGATNPAAPSFYAVGSTVNESSMSRLASLNGVDDFCLYAPAVPGDTIGDLEAEVVAYCTKPRNGARLIPDGTIQSAHFIKTASYVQIYGLWDGTKVNIKSGDYGGELDPHGATGLGNPVGGNVTSNVSGKDVFYEEWMQYVAFDSFCFRICTSENSTISAAEQCQHTLDVMGCSYVMAIPDMYSSAHPFSSCQGEVAPPPGVYPLANGSTSTFAQRYTGSYTNSGTLAYWTVGQTVTPSAPAFYPATSNCVAYSTISNGVNTGNYAVTASPAAASGGSSYDAVAAAVATSNSTTTTTSMSASMTSGASSRSNSGSMVTTSASASGSVSAASAAVSSAKSGASQTASFRGFGAAIACVAAMAAGVLIVV